MTKILLGLTISISVLTSAKEIGITSNVLNFKQFNYTMLKQINSDSNWYMGGVTNSEVSWIDNPLFENPNLNLDASYRSLLSGIFTPMYTIVNTDKAIVGFLGRVGLNFSTNDVGHYDDNGN